jgi:outer membrane lipoprotein
MRRFILLIIIFIIVSCAPVFNKEITENALINVPISTLKQQPMAYRDRIFILGGLIVSTKIIERGSIIEAVNIPVDSFGYLKDTRYANGRFLALLPHEKGILDPLIYKQGRYVTIAGRFIELQKGKIDELPYEYPLFEIIDIYLWEEKKEYIIVPQYYPYPLWYDPWWRYYPYTPWWW